MQMKVRQKNKILIKKHLSVCTGVFVYLRGDRYEI